MDKTTKSYLDRLKESPLISTWVTDKGYLLEGVLMAKEDNSLLLKINLKSQEVIKFEYIQQVSKRNNLGYRLFPHPSQNTIYPSNISNEYHLNIQYALHCSITDKQKNVFGERNVAEYSFRSFLYGAIPSSLLKDKMVVETDIPGYDSRTIETSRGTVVASIPVNERHSAMPPVLKIEMESINITFKSKEALSYSDVFMWGARFSDLLAFIHQEFVPLESIKFDKDMVIDPANSIEYVPESYAYRGIVDVESFMSLMQYVVKNYVDKYDYIQSVISDLILYYRDYALGVPDQIQLARLFVSLEQSSNLARKLEPSLKRVDSEEKKNRKSEYQGFIKDVIADHKAISDNIKSFIKNAKPYYVSEGEEPDAIKKIIDLANIVNEQCAIHTNLIFSTKTKMIWQMRNIVAHGLAVSGNEARSKARREFYSNRGLYRQDIEKLIRAYILKVIGANNVDITNYSEPLKAVVHELFESS